MFQRILVGFLFALVAVFVVIYVNDSPDSYSIDGGTKIETFELTE
ncbi:hypothetical protein ACFPU1_10290 [Thalassorhabdus alkalitolerans]|uniref:Uncharacterized protein n=1 Tax=Thalassorhabdus alkalitolerans TaxID=2282697 RepID=A0ABW0YS31_9BACI|nr:hypothetical protein [Thalassobacillus sp. C254]